MSNDIHKQVMQGIQQIVDAMEYCMKRIDENNDSKEKDGYSGDFYFSLPNNIEGRECDSPRLVISSLNLIPNDSNFHIRSYGHDVTFLNLEEFTTLARSMVEFLTKNGIRLWQRVNEGCMRIYTQSARG